jgi:hypothetical protein
VLIGFLAVGWFVIGCSMFETGWSVIGATTFLRLLSFGEDSSHFEQ